MLRIVCAAAIVVATVVVVPPGAEATTVPADVAARYLTHVPALGDVTVIDVGGESNDRKLLAATLQGIVNRSEARIYLRGMRAYAEDQYWLDWYQDQALIGAPTVVDLDTALQTFGPEASGYVLADAAEPWTINTATTAAGALGGVVVTPDTVGAAQAAGLTELDDHRGDWADAATAYAESVEALRGSLDHEAVAIQQPDRHFPRDLYVQQAMAVVYTRPSQPDFDAVYDVIDTFPTEHPVYGYVSDTGEEEVAAVFRLSTADRYLIPTDTTDNLSFHSAIGGPNRTTAPAPATSDVAACTRDQVNVVLSVGDGDNMVIPEAYLPRATGWNSPSRGELPFGWGISPVVSVLMPAVWDHYAATATPNDELVDLMGAGYAAPSLMPSGAELLIDGSRLRTTLGMRTHWSLDLLLGDPKGSGWSQWSDAIDAVGDAPDGFLLNYLDLNAPVRFREPGGRTVLTSQSGEYGATPDELAAEIAAVVELPPADRPLVSFYAVTVWTAGFSAVADALLPLEAEGVRFLTPSQAFACLPDPADPPDPSDPTDPSPIDGPVPATPATPVDGQAAYTG